MPGRSSHCVNISQNYRNILGTKTLGDILAERETIAHDMQVSLDEATDPWGVYIERVGGDGDVDYDDDQAGKSTPGPLAPPESKRPSRKITARSYSWTTFNIYTILNDEELDENKDDSIMGRSRWI